MQFLGRYEVLGEIASGGMGKVYLARILGEGGFEREVALKVMHPHLLEEPAFVSMFLDEARLAARIRHPNVVPTLDVQRSAEGLFLVMDFVEGLSLAAMVSELKRRAGTPEPATGEHVTFSPGKPAVVEAADPRRLVPLGIALRVLRDVLHGLHEAHELTDRDGRPLNLVHRDVTPGNILVGKDGGARITDFGVARAEARLTTTKGGQIKGKLPYMPPEQLTCDQVDRRSDVYAVGVVMWEMLVGRGLFRAEHEGALLKKVLAGAPHSPRAANALVPESVDQLCMTALALDPRSRPQSAAEFADAIDERVRASGLELATPRAVGAFVRKFTLNTAALPERRSAPGSYPGSGAGSDGAGTRSSAASRAVGQPSPPAAGADAPLSAVTRGPTGGEGGSTGPSTSQHGAVSRGVDIGGSGEISTPRPERGAGSRRRWIAAAVVIAAMVALAAGVSRVVGRGQGWPATDSATAGHEPRAAASGEPEPGKAPSGPAAATTASDAGATAGVPRASAVAAGSHGGPMPRPVRPPQRPSATAQPTSTESLPSDYFPVEP